MPVAHAHLLVTHNDLGLLRPLRREQQRRTAVYIMPSATIMALPFCWWNAPYLPPSTRDVLVSAAQHLAVCSPTMQAKRWRRRAARVLLQQRRHRLEQQVARQAAPAAMTTNDAARGR